MRKSTNKWGKTALFAFVALDCVGIYAAYQKVNPPIDTNADVPQIAANDLAVPPIGAGAPQFHGESAPTAVVPGLVQPVSRAAERMAVNDAPKAVAPAAVPVARSQPVLALAAMAPAPKAAAPKSAAPIGAPSFVAPLAHALAVKTAPKAATPKVAAPLREAAPHFAVSDAPQGKTLVALQPEPKAKAARTSSTKLASVAHYSHAKRDGRLFAKAFEHAFGPVSQPAPLLENPVAGGVTAQAYAEPAPLDANAAVAQLDQPGAPSVAAVAPSLAVPAPAAPAAVPATDAELPPA